MPIVIKEMQYKDREELFVLLQEFDDIDSKNKVEIQAGKSNLSTLALIAAIGNIIVNAHHIQVIYVTSSENINQLMLEIIKDGLKDEKLEKDFVIVFLFQKEE